MQARLDALGTDLTDPIKLHVDAIRRIHAQVPRTPSGAPTHEELNLLHEADHLWLKIMVLRDLVPLAKKGEPFSRRKQKGNVSQVTRYLRRQRRQGQTARALWKRLKALGASDERPVYFDGDEMIDKRAEKPISYKAFEKRLIGSKK